MKLTSIFKKSHIVDGIEAGKKKSIIEQLVAVLEKREILDEKQAKSVVRAAMRREDLGSTGIGCSMAIPHAKVDCVDDICGVLGRCPEGADFKSLDGEDVFLFFLVLVSKNKPDLHLKTLSRISKLAKNKDFIRFLKEAEKKDIYSVLKEADEMIPDE